MSNPVAEPATARPAICLNMIARNEAHVVAEVLDAVAPYISSWVIVDTGSEDGTQDLIRSHLAGLGIPGELHERPWRNFGHNRSEALTLAQGHADYIWVMDADDTLVGTPDFNGLDADIYFMRLKDGANIYWYPTLFRDGVNVQYVGVTHESPTWDSPCAVARLEGQYRVEDRHLGSRSVDPQKYAWDRDLLLAEIESNPEDTRSVFFLAQSYFNLGDFVNAHRWYTRRVEMGGDYTEQVYYSMCQVAEALAHLGAPWRDVQDAYLKAWEFRPTRAEPLYALAYRYREQQRYRLGYLFAECAAKIPFPDEDIILVRNDIYDWRASDEQAVCASWIGKHAEAFTLWRHILARPDIPDGDRQRIAGNRDVCVPTLLEAAAAYPDALVASLNRRVTDGGGDDAGAGAGVVVVSLIAGPDRSATEQTLNSFLRCCLDVSRVRRFLVVDAGLSPEDRAILLARYGFVEFAVPSTGTQLTQLRGQINAPYWLHLGAGWRFFAPETFIARLTAVLQAEPQVFQVGINFTDAVALTGTTAAEEAIRRTPDGGRYLRTDAVASGPAMFDCARFDQADGLLSASLDEVFCIAAP